MIGVHLDSGDGAALSIKARQMLDEAGFTNAKIVGSGDLDEYMITDLKQRGAKIDVWGVEQSLAPVSPAPLSVASINSAPPGPRRGMAIPHQTLRRISENFDPRLVAGSPISSSRWEIHRGCDLRS